MKIVVKNHYYQQEIRLLMDDGGTVRQVLIMQAI